jgi:hypothetical protein
MNKKLSLLAVAAAVLMTGSAAMAEENLETTQNRAAGLENYRNVYLQERAPAAQRNVRTNRQAPTSRAAEENWFDRADGVPGQGG